ncbi:MAG TPA: hypothetical protein VKQ30_12320 [Ktedonobacterales bacterium]|nr:hypothetical protein [Ktedonobacterales bacterium]
MKTLPASPTRGMPLPARAVTAAAAAAATPAGAATNLLVALAAIHRLVATRLEGHACLTAAG